MFQSILILLAVITAFNFHVHGYIKLQGEHFPSCLKTDKIYLVEENCKDINVEDCNAIKTKFDEYRTLEDEYIFADSQKSSVVYSSGGELFKANCDLSDHIIIQEFDFSTKQCTRDIDLVYNTVTESINTYSKGAMNKFGIIHPGNKLVDCDGKPNFFSTINNTFHFVKTNNSVKLDSKQFIEKNSTCKFDYDSFRKSDFYQIFLECMSILIFLANLFRYKLQNLGNKIKKKFKGNDQEQKIEDSFKVSVAPTNTIDSFTINSDFDNALVDLFTKMDKSIDANSKKIDATSEKIVLLFENLLNECKKTNVKTIRGGSNY
jgi:hypothetical protein